MSKKSIFPSFRQRSEEVEIMDDLQIEGQVIDQTLKELEIINTWLGGNNITIQGLDQIIKTINHKNRVITIADIGCGGGDMLVLIAKWARKNKIKVKLTGIDANPAIIAYARKRSELYPEISYKVMNIFSDAFKSLQFDIIASTLFCHHFDDTALTKLLSQWKKQSNLAVLINDLHRHWMAYYSIKALTYCFSRSYMVKNDAGVSVLRSFRNTELQNILKKAGFGTFDIEWKWAFRYKIIAWSSGVGNIN